MAKKSLGAKLGSWAFLIGVVLALLVGIMQKDSASIGGNMIYVLVILGIIIGLLNIAGHEVAPFLMAGTVLVIVSTFGASVIGEIALFQRILEALTTLFVPATIIVALKHVFSLAKD